MQMDLFGGASGVDGSVPLVGKPVMPPMVSYYGGKQRMVRYALGLLPPHRVFAEPFCGGASVLFAKPRPEGTNQDHGIEAINDTNDLLITMYRVARDHPDELLRVLQGTLYSQAEHRRSKAILKDPESHDPLWVAWAVWVNLQMSFSHKLNAGFGYSVQENKAATFANKLDRLPMQLERLKGVLMDSVDALRFIERFDSPDTVFYCDPPYPGTDCGHYGGYTLEDFHALVSVLDGIQGRFLLSNYEQPGIPDHWTRHEFVASRSARNPRHGVTPSKVTQEIIWTNF